jgi:hypothetical protein
VRFSIHVQFAPKERGGVFENPRFQPDMVKVKTKEVLPCPQLCPMDLVFGPI